MFLLTRFGAWTDSTRLLVMMNRNKLIRNYLMYIKFLFGLIVVLLGQTTARAESIDVNALTPILNFILEEKVQCPSIEPSVVIDDSGVLIGFSTPKNQIDGDVFISSQENINDLEDIVRVNGSVIFATQMASQSLDLSPLSSLVEVTGRILLNTGNTRINGFSCLTTVGGDLNIQNNNSLKTINAFPLLESVGGSLSVSINPELERIVGFQSLSSIGRDVNIFTNDELESINSFSLIASIGGSLNIVDNARLLSLGGFGFLSRDNVLGDISIVSNTSFDCANPVPSFSPVTFSSGNTVDCEQDLMPSRFGVRNNQAVMIEDLESVSSSLVLPSEVDLSGTIESLQVTLDITHSAVGDLTVQLSNGTTTINLLDRPTELVSEDDLSEAIARECAVEDFETDFLSEQIGGDRQVEFNSFSSIDIDCAIELALNFNENAVACDSNDIIVQLTDEDALQPINSSCESGVADSQTAFPLAFYSPLEALSAFDGSDVDVTWTLTVTDSKTGDIGVLNSWGILFDIDR